MYYEVLQNSYFTFCFFFMFRVCPARAAGLHISKRSKLITASVLHKHLAKQLYRILALLNFLKCAAEKSFANMKETSTLNLIGSLLSFYQYKITLN